MRVTAPCAGANTSLRLIAAARWGSTLVARAQIVERVQPTVLIGCSSDPSRPVHISEAAIRALAKTAARPVILALSSPTCEISAAEAYHWSGGKAVYANFEGPQEEVFAAGRELKPSKVQSVYIFPGLTLGTCVARWEPPSMLAFGCCYLRHAARVGSLATRSASRSCCSLTPRARCGRSNGHTSRARCSRAICEACDEHAREQEAELVPSDFMLSRLLSPSCSLCSACDPRGSCVTNRGACGIVANTELGAAQRWSAVIATPSCLNPPCGCRSNSVRQEQLLAAAKAVARLTSDEDRAAGRVLPP